jgi:hypothetical protein
MIHLTDIHISDFNSDGLQDLTFIGTGLDTRESLGDYVYYYRNTGNGFVNVSDELDFTERGFFHSSAIGDFNGDGHEDLTFWQSEFEPSIEFKESAGVILMNTGAGDFVRDREMVPAEFRPYYLTEVLHGDDVPPDFIRWGVSDISTADLNGTGCDDIVIGSQGIHNPSMILFNHCEGTLSKPAASADLVPIGTFLIPSVKGYDRVLNSFVFPINDDEFVDIAILRTGDLAHDDYKGNYLQFLRNNGDETFTDVTNTMIVQSTGPATLNRAHVHDFDDDGYLDIVFTIGAGFNEQEFTDVLWRGTATGLEQVDVDIDHLNGSLIVADTDSDGDMDLLLRNVKNVGLEEQAVEYRLLENITN